MTGEIVDDGLGSLVLTALFPFQQTQPMVRYDTGDLVETNPQRFGGRVVFKPLGRRIHSVQDPVTREWLLPAATLYEIMECCPYSARRPLFLDAPRNVRDPLLAGYSKFQLDAKPGIPGAISLQFERLPNSVGVGERALRREILERAPPALGRAVEAGRWTLEVRGVERLAD